MILYEIIVVSHMVPMVQQPNKYFRCACNIAYLINIGAFYNKQYNNNTYYSVPIKYELPIRSNNLSL